MCNPQQQYQQRLAERQARAARLDRLHYQVAQGRLLAFAAIVLGVGLAVGRSLPSGLLLLPMVCFAALLVWHARLTLRWDHARRAARFYEEGLRRLDGSWMGRGTAGSHYLDAQHPYARDLDIFGPSSLFELLCGARTRPGEDCLAAWLSTGGSPAVVAERRLAVGELVNRLDLREDLAALYEGRSSLSAPALVAWAQASPRLTSLPMRLLAAGLGLAGLSALIYWIISWDPRPLLGVLLLQQLFNLWPGQQLKAVIREVEPIRRDCRSLAVFLQRLEQERFLSPLLDRWRQPWPSHALASLERLLDLLETRRNVFISPFVYVSLATLQGACEIERWRRRFGSQLGPWLEAMAEFEALSSLARFAWENPAYVWPELSEPGTGLQAQGLGHPLLGSNCVGNDLDLSQVSLWMVSGSNMAGKSSLLRALGSNVVLAMAGAPVRAQSLRLEPLQPGASIQLADSLVGGLSRFYAEILRLRQIVELASNQPRLLFLLDEIMGGTNSHDRRIGAEAVIRSLVSQGALGLVTTHDLALTAIVDELQPKAANVHFEDQLEDGKMSFDYRLRPGPVTRSNALELMRAVGLEV